MRAGYERIGRTVPVDKAARACLDKRRFATRNAARDKAAKYEILNPDWKPQRPYRCTLCGGFHLTSAPASPGGTILRKRSMP